MSTDALNPRLSTGLAGLDEILNGGLIAGRSYLLRGGPGTGKTMMGAHFLMAGIASGQRSLFVTLEESMDNILQNCASVGLDLGQCQFLDFSPPAEVFSQDETYDIFSPSEVEHRPFAEKIIESLDKLNPDRIFLDPLIQFRYLTPDFYQYHKQVAAFLRFITNRKITLLLTSESSHQAPDDDLQFMADGVIELQQLSSGARTVSVNKFRGSNFRTGIHSMALTDHGAQVFPRLIPDLRATSFDSGVIASGVPQLDELLYGGVERGTVTIITGPSGAGKTTLGIQFMKEAAGRGEHSIIYSFEEAIEVMLRRCESVNIPARSMIEKGTLSIEKLEPLQMTPDQFSQVVRNHVEQRKAKIVMIDSLSGYRLTVGPTEVVSRLHGLVKYLQNMGVAVFLLVETPNVIGDFQITDIGVSYLADNTIFLRYLEIEGQLSKAIGVLKKRLSDFERTLRKFEISRYGIMVGKPLSNLRGILTGTPEWIKPEGVQ